MEGWLFVGGSIVIGTLLTLFIGRREARKFREWQVQYKKDSKEMGEDVAFYNAYISLL